MYYIYKKHNKKKKIALTSIIKLQSHEYIIFQFCCWEIVDRLDLKSVYPYETEHLHELLTYFQRNSPLIPLSLHMPPLVCFINKHTFRMLFCKCMIESWEKMGRKMAGRILLIQVEYINALITQTMLNYSGAGIILWDQLSSWLLLLSTEHTFIKLCSIPSTLGNCSVGRGEKEIRSHCLSCDNQIYMKNSWRTWILSLFSLTRNCSARINSFSLMSVQGI